MTGQFSLHSLILLIAVVPYMVAVVSDVRSYTIPHGCTLALLALYPAHVWLSPLAINLTASLLVGGTAFAVGLAFYALNRLGGGDVKLIAAAALWAGPALIADFAVTMAVSGGLLSLLYITHFHIAPALGFDHAGLRNGLREERNSLMIKLPYGVAISAGGLVTLLQLA